MNRNTAISRLHRAAACLDGPVHREIVAEARRLDRPVSWILQVAWMRARERIAALPAAPIARTKDHGPASPGPQQTATKKENP